MWLRTELARSYANERLIAGDFSLYGRHQQRPKTFFERKIAFLHAAWPTDLVDDHSTASAGPLPVEDIPFTF